MSMSFYLKTPEPGLERGYTELSSNSFDLGSNPKRIRTENSSMSKRSSSQVRSVNNSTHNTNPFSSYDSSSLHLLFKKAPKKSTMVKRRTTPIHKDDKVPRKNYAVNANRSFTDNRGGSNNIKAKSNFETIKKPSERESISNHPSILGVHEKSPYWNLPSQENTVQQMVAEFQEFCDLLRSREEENTKLTTNLKDRFNKIVDHIVRKVAHEEENRQQTLLLQEIQKLTLKNHELQLKLNSSENENQKLWGVFSKMHVIGQVSSSDLKGSRDVVELIQKHNKSNGKQHSSHERADKVDFSSFVDIIENQRQKIDVLEKKEAKYLKLLTIIKSQGVDIQRIYQQEVRSRPRSSSKQKISFDNQNSVTKMSSYERKGPIKAMQNGIIRKGSPIAMKYSDHPNNDSQIFDETYQQVESEQDYNDESILAKNYGAVLTNLTYSDREVNHQKDYEMRQDNEMRQDTEDENFVLYSYRDQLNMEPSKLNSNDNVDYSPAKPSQQPAKFKLNMGAVKSHEPQGQSPVGFHQEFMSQIDQFSLSWRQAAQREKKIP